MGAFHISSSPERGANGTQYERNILFTLLALAFIVIHFVLLMSFFEPAISTPDANSYFTQAKLIATEGRTYFEPKSPLQYIGPHWHHTRDNRYYCTHPPGFPAVLSIIYMTFGPRATLWVNPLLASLTLLGLFLLCRLWIGTGWALLAVALMAVNPFANEHALFGDSHTAVSFFLVWTLLFLARWLKTHSPWWILGAGLFAGIIPTIRYPEFIYLPAIVLFVLLHLERDKASWRSLIAGAIGFAMPVGALCVRNQLAYDAFWKTGYVLTDEQAAFGLRHLASNALPYLQKLIGEGCALLFCLGIIGIAILCGHRNNWKKGLLLALLVVPITLLYMSWYWKPDPQSMRFLLPTFYIYTIATAWLLRLLANHHRSLMRVGCLVLLLITIGWALPRSVPSMHNLKDRNAVLAQVTGALEEHVEPGSILIANEGIDQHLDFLGYWRLIDATILRSPGAKPSRIPAPHQGVPPQRMPRNVQARLKYAGVTAEELFKAFSDDVWQWAGKKQKVYLLAKEEQIGSFKRQLSPYDQLIAIDVIELPEISPKHFKTRPGFRPPKRDVDNFKPPQGPMGPNHIFDLFLDGKPLLLVQWTRELAGAL